MQWSYTFTDRVGTRPQLHGYTIGTEGVQLTPNGTVLNRFLGRVVAELGRDESRHRSPHGPFFRYPPDARVEAAGPTSCAAGPVANLLVAASGAPAFPARVAALVETFDPARIAALLSEVLATVILAHPLLTPARSGEYVGAAGTPACGALLKSAVEEVRDARKFRDDLRSPLPHGLLVESHGLFVIHGRGDERQVLGHARLPVPFPAAGDHTLAVSESGDHGDGTTRTFRVHPDEPLGEWLRGEPGGRPDAAGDALLDLMFKR